MPAEKVRIGIVGAGENTRSKHIPGLRAMDGIEIVSVCNRRRHSSEQVAERFDIPQVYDNWEELVVSADTDAIVIGTWPYLHCPVTLKALEAEKHVLCEARMAMDAREAWQMLEASRLRPHLITQVVPAPFTLAVDRSVQRLIAQGYLGDLLAIEVHAKGNEFIDLDSPLHWRQDSDLSGLNIMSLGIWYETILRWVGQATQVMAMGRTYVRMRFDPDEEIMKSVRIPEHLDVIASMACGAQASFSISSVTGLSGRKAIYVYGSQGTLCFRDGKLYGGQRSAPALQEIDIPPEEARGWRVEEEFINAIRGLESVTHTTFEDGFKYMQFTEAVARSIASGRAVSLPLFP